MSWLDRLERIFGRFAVPNLSLYIVIGQVFVLFTSMLHLISLEKLVLFPALVAEGEWWRVLTFIFFVVPPAGLFGYLFLAFEWYLFYLMGSALEDYWGAFRFNVFLLIGVALTVGLSFFTPGVPVPNRYVLLSVFLAFAYLNPDFELLLIIIPVKVKWLALLTCVFWAVEVILGPLSVRLQIAAPTVAWLLFFGPSVARGMKQGRRVASRRAEREREREQPRHVCHVCGKNDITHPDLDFRYCSKCAGDQCYCPEHIHNHAHVVAPEGQS